MKILAITWESPWPVINGQRMRSSFLIEQLSKKNKLDLVIASKKEKDYPKTINQIECFDQKASIDIKSIFSLLTKKSIYQTRFQNKKVSEVIFEKLKSKNYDFIFVEGLPAMSLVNFSSQVPIWLDEHNVESSLMKQNSMLDDSILKKALYKLESNALKQWEIKCLQASKFTSFCSDLDINSINSSIDSILLDSKNSDVIDNTTSPSPKIKNATQVQTLWYTGQMNWKPNIDAVLWFLKKTWPIITQHNPNIVFKIVGRNPNIEITKLATSLKNVIVVGEVDSIPQTLSQGGVLICPLRIGSGTRLKIVEAASMGLPVISTSIGAEGLNFKNNQDIIISDSPEDFAQNCIKLLSSNQIWNTFSDNIYSAYNKLYHPAVIQRKIDFSLSKVRELIHV